MSEKVSITKSKLDSLANAIAAVGGTSIPKTLSQMESAVLELTIPPNLETITIKPENCASSSTQITPETYICETDSSYPGTVISMSSTYCNIGKFLNSNIKIELNKTYHCVGQLFIKWDDDDTEEYYYIDSDFNMPSLYSGIVDLPSFTWEGSTGATQIFSSMKLSISNTSYGYNTMMRPMRSNAITKSGVLLPGSFYRITQVNTDGYNTINLDFNSDPRFYRIYQSLAYRSKIASSAPYVSEWCNSLSSFSTQQFAGQPFSGDFTFNNIGSICQYAFGSVFTGTQTGTWDYFGLNFPSCSSIYIAAFVSNTYLQSVSFPECTTIGSSAFQNCVKLTTISFPKCTFIGSYAFQGCINLFTVSFPECTSLGNYAFFNCSNLTTVFFSECTSIGGCAFQSCFKLTTASFPKCTSISVGAFSNCYSLSDISFPQCNSIMNMAFYSCSALTTISLPNCIYLSTYVFRFCRNLSSFYFMGSSIPSIQSTTFANTPIIDSTYLGYYGSIYVPSSLLADYKTATNWATYSTRMVGI